MPNWVSNIVRCDDDHVETLLLLQDFSNIVPCIEEPLFPPYDWCIEHWHTKCNAARFRLSMNHPRKGTYVQFDTAWSHPGALITALSRRFPQRRFSVSYSDEDTGRNCGRYVIQNGEILEGGKLPDYSRAAYDLTFEHWPTDRAFFRLKGDNYELLPRAERDRMESLLIEIGLF